MVSKRNRRNTQAAYFEDSLTPHESGERKSSEDEADSVRRIGCAEFRRAIFARERNLEMKPDTKTFLCSYHHDDALWSVEIHAYDWADAEARVKKLGYLKLDGELKVTIPVRLGFIAKLLCWIRNLWNDGGKA
jgi:hypothetical protein